MKTAIISSAIYGLENYRAAVERGCRRAKVFPLMMEDLSAIQNKPIQESMRLVEEADFYIGVFSHRYGTYINGLNKSYTELEFEKAKEKAIPLLIFISNEKLISPGDATPDVIEQLQKITQFYKRIEGERCRKTFVNEDQLESYVYQSLIENKELSMAGSSLFPTIPEAFIPHPYSLLNTTSTIGRKKEKTQLNDWVTSKELPIFVMVGIGGMGKSALGWQWFNEFIDSGNSFQGKVWWSFYENKNFDDFIDHIVSYLTLTPLSEVKIKNKAEKDIILYKILNESKNIVVLDGLERILFAYNETDSHVSIECSQSTSHSDEKFKRLTHLEYGKYLALFSKIKSSKIFITTRLYPANLENPNGDPIPGVKHLELLGLNDEDALNFWYALGMPTYFDENGLLLEYFHYFNNYPLLIKILSGIVSKFKRFKYRQRSFKEWVEKNQRFKLFDQEIIQVKNNILKYSIKNLNINTKYVLTVLSAFKMVVKYEILWSLCCNKDYNQDEFDEILIDLEERGLVGWNKEQNTYDLHPVIRGVVWGTVADEASKRKALHLIEEYLKPILDFKEYAFLENRLAEDLFPENEAPSAYKGALETVELSLELFNSLILQNKFDAAFNITQNRLKPLIHSEKFYKKYIECLNFLFVKDSDSITPLFNKSLALGDVNEGMDFHQAGFHDYSKYCYNNHLERCNKVECKLHIAFCGSDYSLYKENEIIYLEVFEKWLKEGNSSGFTIYPFITYCLNDLLSRGYKEEVENIVRINKVHDLSNINYSLALLNNNFKEALHWSNEYFVHALLTHGERGKFSIPYFYKLLVRVKSNEQSDELEKDLQDYLTRGISCGMFLYVIRTSILLAKYYLNKNILIDAEVTIQSAYHLCLNPTIPKLCADVFLILSNIKSKQGDFNSAIIYAHTAYNVANGEGPNYSEYWLLLEAKEHLKKLNQAFTTLPLNMILSDTTKLLLQYLEQVVQMKDS